MKRILIFNDSLELAGTERLLTSILRHIAENKHQVTLLLPMPSEKDALIEEVPVSVNIKYIFEKGTSRKKLWFYKNLMLFFTSIFIWLKKIKASDYDEIICFKEGFYAKIFSEMPCLKILWIHNILYTPKYEVHSTKERLAVWLNKKQIKKTRDSYKKYEKVICVSDACKDAFTGTLYESQKIKQSIEVIYNAINIDRIREKAKENIEDLPQGITKFIVVTRDSPEKRIDRLINAAQRLNDEQTKFHLYIIGSYNHALGEKVKLLNLENEITFIGKIENPYPYILQSNWLVCSSERESFSLAILEAMALDTPVISTDCGGPRNILNNGRYGILVENSAEGVYKGMKSVLDNPSLSVQYSSELSSAIKRFDYKAWLKHLDGILETEN